ncbi:MAG: hypothetical protein WDN31_18645 [Hyphomicrobium sp.]
MFGVRGGLTGIIAPALTRPDIARALRARHTWATTGERIVGLLSTDGAIQGDEVAATGPMTLRYRLLGNAGWDYVAVYDHTGIIAERNLQAEAGFSARRIRFRWAARASAIATGPPGGRASSRSATASSIPSRRTASSTPRKTPGGVARTEVAFSSETYGDADTIELDVSGLPDAAITIEGTIGEYQKIGDARAHSPFAHRPEFRWEATGAELLSAGQLRRDLGGEGLFLALERLTDAPLPLEVAGEIDIEPRNGPHGFRPVYVHGRQIDDEKVWTSPLFITFAG